MLDLLAQDLHGRGNAVEAVIWWLIAATFAYYATRQSGPVRRRCWIAAVTFLLFGFSGIIEAQTGAWWRPWWLLAWKAACVVAMVWLLHDDWRARRNGGESSTGDQSSSTDDRPDSH